MMLAHYESKKELKAAIGQPLNYTETSLFGEEYLSDGVLYVARFCQAGINLWCQPIGGNLNEEEVT